MCVLLLIKNQAPRYKDNENRFLTLLAHKMETYETESLYVSALPNEVSDSFFFFFFFYGNSKLYLVKNVIYGAAFSLVQQQLFGTIRGRRRAFPFRKQAMRFLTVDAIIGKQACQDSRCYFLSSVGQMPLETARQAGKWTGHQQLRGCRKWLAFYSD